MNRVIGFGISLLGLGLFASLVVACGDGNDSGQDAGPVGGPVAGAADTHCSGRSQATDPSRCMFRPDLAGDSPDGGTMEEEAAVLYNAEGDDDDCKYHVKWSATAVRRDTDITFTVTVTRKSDGQPATGAEPEAQVFLDDTHPAPDTTQSAHEHGAGVYTVGPVRVDAGGRWTVRFHFYDSCFDFLEESPHGHAAFYLDVP